jgi:hypothetical protein
VQDEILTTPSISDTFGELTESSEKMSYRFEHTSDIQQQQCQQMEVFTRV